MKFIRNIILFLVLFSTGEMTAQFTTKGTSAPLAETRTDRYSKKDSADIIDNYSTEELIDELCKEMDKNADLHDLILAKEEEISHWRNEANRLALRVADLEADNQRLRQENQFLKGENNSLTCQLRISREETAKEKALRIAAEQRWEAERAKRVELERELAYEISLRKRVEQREIALQLKIDSLFERLELLQEYHNNQQVSWQREARLLNQQISKLEDERDELSSFSNRTMIYYKKQRKRGRDIVILDTTVDGAESTKKHHFIDKIHHIYLDQILLWQGKPPAVIPVKCRIHKGHEFFDEIDFELTLDSNATKKHRKNSSHTGETETHVFKGIKKLILKGPKSNIRQFEGNVEYNFEILNMLDEKETILRTGILEFNEIKKR